MHTETGEELRQRLEKLSALVEKHTGIPAVVKFFDNYDLPSPLFVVPTNYNFSGKNDEQTLTQSRGILVVANRYFLDNLGNLSDDTVLVMLAHEFSHGIYKTREEKKVDRKLAINGASVLSREMNILVNHAKEHNSDTLGIEILKKIKIAESINKTGTFNQIEIDKKVNFVIDEYQMLMKEQDVRNSNTHPGVKNRILVMHKGIEHSDFALEVFAKVQKGEYFDIRTKNLTADQSEMLQIAKAVYRDATGELYVIDKNDIGYDSNFEYKLLDLKYSIIAKENYIDIEKENYTDNYR